MAIVATHNLGKSFGILNVFAGLTLSIHNGARIAAVGLNGVPILDDVRTASLEVG